MLVDPRAVVSPEAEIAEDVKIGAFSIIEPDVKIGPGTEIASNVVIASGSRIGKDNRFFHGAVIGTVPQDLKFAGERTTVEIGDNNTFREYCTVNRGTSETGRTKIGSGCLIMTYVHIAHDCVLGDNIILSNAVNMAGHVDIDDNAIIGGMSPIHQFVHIGKYAFIGGGEKVRKDVPPYIKAAGDPLSYKGINSVGLRRHGFEQETRSEIKEVYQTIFRKNMNITQALDSLKHEEETRPEIREIYRFIENSKRGLITSRDADR